MKARREISIGEQARDMARDALDALEADPMVVWGTYRRWIRDNASDLAEWISRAKGRALTGAEFIGAVNAMWRKSRDIVPCYTPEKRAKYVLGACVKTLDGCLADDRQRLRASKRGNAATRLCASVRLDGDSVVVVGEVLAAYARGVQGEYVYFSFPWGEEVIQYERESLARFASLKRKDPKSDLRVEFRRERLSGGQWGNPSLVVSWVCATGERKGRLRLQGWTRSCGYADTPLHLGPLPDAEPVAVVEVAAPVAVVEVAAPVAVVEVAVWLPVLIPAAPLCAYVTRRGRYVAAYGEDKAKVEGSARTLSGAIGELARQWPGAIVSAIVPATGAWQVHRTRAGWIASWEGRTGRGSTPEQALKALRG